ncbi:hypothetical protein [Natronobeatus ordinarius]|uniref:hypothetical protein n=1 Tax=Natronobeatus ordinarius TaxID=2963433 RepID=UPI0020CFC866|nr:hypothetical protein [Natronobeatus ordinarius]
MDVQSPVRVPATLDLPGSVPLQVAFLALWFVDMVAASLFFVFPEPTELNPVTVFFFELFGLPGVVLAATCYAAAVVAISHVLSAPADDRFLIVVVSMYTAFVGNNVALLAFGNAPLGDLLATML